MQSVWLLTMLMIESDQRTAMSKARLLDELIETFVKKDAPDWVKDRIREELSRIIGEH